ncbi:MAG: monovalent cation/H(+) antiporter subunit G [Thioalkalispiraceae bacterium]|jgi:multicomponent Na+:H+ antiporter subunit G
MIELLASILIISGLVFFIAGSIGLLRLPDLYSRLHALTKADNLGLGLLLLGIMLLAGDLIVAAKLFLVWLLVIASGATSAQLIAEYTRRKERQS